MNLKEELGKKIKSIRLDKGFTQLDICNDEAELTIRQLVRIEKGESLPSLTKIKYISEQLDVDMRDLIDIDKIILPKKYLEIKNKLIKYRAYGDEGRINHKSDLIDKIYVDYYDNLPEEEQVIIEAMQLELDVYSSKNPNYAISFLDEYFKQVLKKDRYTYNDLFIIRLYFLCCIMGLEDNQYFDELSTKVIKNIDYSNYDNLYMLERIILNIIVSIDPNKFLEYANMLDRIIAETNNYQHKPLVYAVKAKYHVLVDKDFEKASVLYDKAIQFATLLEDEVLIKNLTKEKEDDIPK